MIRTAFLIDGDFFIRRYSALRGRQSPHDTAAELHKMCMKHLYPKPKSGQRKTRQSELYRIFYYDCPPLTKKAHHPITKQSIDFSKTDIARWRTAFFEELKKLRKVALRNTAGPRLNECSQSKSRQRRTSNS